MPTDRRSGVFPFAPLAGVLAARSDGERAVLLGVSRRTVIRWRRGALLRLDDADRVATRLGVHPSTIWRDFDDVSERIERADDARRARIYAAKLASNRAAYWRRRAAA